MKANHNEKFYDYIDGRVGKERIYRGIEIQFTADGMDVQGKFNRTVEELKSFCGPVRSDAEQ